MSKMIQIRNVPDNVHRTLKARAAESGTTLSDYLLAEVQELAHLPTVDELTERIRRRAPNLKGSSAPTIRSARDAR
ncbi:MAG: hypothetical protein AAB295_01210 [Chloroflexota bacterium]